MFDYRYHALSLAAVLFALALGILIGVAIGDSNLVSSAKNGIVHNLNSEVSEAHGKATRLQGRLSNEEAFVNGLYPLAVHELLTGRSVGLVFLGGSSDQVDSLVRRSVTQAGGELATVVAVREPLDLTGIAHDAAGTHYAALAGSPPLIEHFGELMGRQLVSGGQLVAKELLSRVRDSLLSAFDGQLTHLEGLVVMRAEPAGMSPQASEDSAAFETGLLAGAATAGAPAVGVELTGNQVSQVPWYKEKGLSSVDDLDALRRTDGARLCACRRPRHVRGEVHRRLAAADRHHRSRPALSAPLERVRSRSLASSHARPALRDRPGRSRRSWRRRCCRSLEDGGHRRANYRDRPLAVPLRRAHAGRGPGRADTADAGAAARAGRGARTPRRCRSSLYALGVLALGLIDDTLARESSEGAGTPRARLARPRRGGAAGRALHRSPEGGWARSGWRCWR